MNHKDIYDYMYNVFSNCFKNIFVNQVIINNYYFNYKRPETKSKIVQFHKLEDDNYGFYSENKSSNLNSDKYFNKTPHLNLNQNINKRIICHECKSKIYGQIYMFNDNSFCRDYCRSKSMSRKKIFI